jgi:hypothetical protein
MNPNPIFMCRVGILTKTLLDELPIQGLCLGSATNLLAQKGLRQ